MLRMLEKSNNQLSKQLQLEKESDYFEGLSTLFPTLKEYGGFYERVDLK